MSNYTIRILYRHNPSIVEIIGDESLRGLYNDIYTAILDAKSSLLISGGNKLPIMVSPSEIINLELTKK